MSASKRLGHYSFARIGTFVVTLLLLAVGLWLFHFTTKDDPWPTVYGALVIGAGFAIPLALLPALDKGESSKPQSDVVMN